MTHLRFIVAATALSVALGLSTHTHAARADEYHLLPGPAVTLGVNESVHLSVYLVDAGDNLKDATLEAASNVAWTVNGSPVDRVDPSAGRLSVAMLIQNATYTAPANVPQRNPVAIGLTFRPAGASATQTLVCNVTVIDKGNYFSVTGLRAGKNDYQLNDQFSSPMMQARFARAMAMGPETAITVGPMEPAGVQGMGGSLNVSANVTLMIAGGAVGSYDWTIPGSSATTVMLMIGHSDGMEQYMSADCVPHGDPNCTPVALNGATRIASIDQATHQMRGAFEGRIVKIVNGRPTTYANVVGRFKATMQGVGGLR